MTYRAGILLITLLSAAMGVQSAAVRRVGEQRIATTYVTGTLTNLAMDVTTRLFLRSPDALPLLGGLWTAYVGGAMSVNCPYVDTLKRTPST